MILWLTQTITKKNFKGCRNPFLENDMFNRIN